MNDETRQAVSETIEETEFETIILLEQKLATNYTNYTNYYLIFISVICVIRGKKKLC